MGERIRRTWVALALAVVGLVLGMASGGLVLAAESDGASGFAISPAFGQLAVAPDQPRVEYVLKLANRNAAEQAFRLSAVDFGSLGEEGGVAFLGQPTSELEHKYGLASWMALDESMVVVRPGQTVNVKVTVDNRASLAPGGHYGAVLATAVTDSAKMAPDAVGVKQVLSSLMLVTKEGGAAPALKLAEQKFAYQFWALPKAVEQRFQNTGNVHVTPRGVVEVRDPRGKVVARAAINEASGVVLPESFRRYKTALMTVTPAWLPGRYQLVSMYRHDGTETMQTGATGFWYVGSLVVWLVGALALVAVGVLAWWLWVRPRRRYGRGRGISLIRQ